VQSFSVSLLDLAEVVVEPVETAVPVLAIPLQPVGGVLERDRLKPARARLRLASASDEAGALEHLEVLGDGGGAVGSVKRGA
jgi:hypothetical protein